MRTMKASIQAWLLAVETVLNALINLTKQQVLGPLPMCHDERVFPDSSIEDLKEEFVYATTRFKKCELLQLYGSLCKYGFPLLFQANEYSPMSSEVGLILVLMKLSGFQTRNQALAWIFMSKSALVTYIVDYDTTC